MTAGGKRASYKISHKLKVVGCAKEHGNRAAARVFGQPPTEKMMRVWRQPGDQLRRAKKENITLVCEIFEVMKLYIVLGVFIAADFKNASSLAVSSLVFLQISILFFTLEKFQHCFKQNTVYETMKRLKSHEKFTLLFCDVNNRQ